MKITIEQFKTNTDANLKTYFFRNLESRLISKKLIEKNDLSYCRNIVFKEVLIELNKFIARRDVENQIFLRIND